MKRLSDLLERFEYECIQGDVQIPIADVVYDSRKIEEGCLFLCIKGANFDGHSAIGAVAEKKAAAVLVQTVPEDLPKGITVIKVADTRLAMANVAAAWFDYPAERLTTIGVTGTKGKTTTVYLVKSVLENAGFRVGLIGTIESIMGDEVIPSLNTTPESFILQKYFAKMVEKGLQVVVMEVSSQGLMMHRTAGFVFDYGIFTNLEPDHIGPNEHVDFDDYLRCKSMLFKQCKVGIVNGDDKHVDEILRGHTCRVEKFGFREDNDLVAGTVTLVEGSGFLGVRFPIGKAIDMEIEAPFPGRFSVYNILTTVSICRHFKVPKEAIINALRTAKVKGRIESVPISDKFSLMIDYAHNAMALESLLTTLREYHPKRLVCLFGCGGNRSRQRRFEMGEVSGRLSDLSILTSDNPRNEEPLEIIADIRTGIEKTKGKFVEIPDRKEAITYAISHAKAGDVIVLAGKGHEDYQEIKGVKYAMDERVLIQEILASGVIPGGAAEEERE